MVCDSPTLNTGFARVAQNLLNRWLDKGVAVDVWAIGYAGWPHPLQRRAQLFPAAPANSPWHSTERLAALLNLIRSGNYTHVWIIQDTFLLAQAEFPKYLKVVCKEKHVRTLLYFPVDATLERGWTEIIAAVDTPVAYTEYGKGEAIRANPALADKGIRVLPHGVDTQIYFPMDDRRKLRRELFHGGWIGDDDILLLNVNAHQRRKDIARSLQVLRALRAMGLPAKLYLHMPSYSDGDMTDLKMVADQLRLTQGKEWQVADKLLINGHEVPAFRNGHGVAGEEHLNRLYNAADIFLTTTLGEGWGLTPTEALAAGCPVAMPAHTACQEIMLGLKERGQENFIRLEIEAEGTVMPIDNSRLRPRVHVQAAAVTIAAACAAGLKRAPLNKEVKRWLSWNRIAGEWWRYFHEVDRVDVQSQGIVTKEGE